MIRRSDTLLVQVAPARSAPNGTAAAALLGIGLVLLWRRASALLASSTIHAKRLGRTQAPA
jgi:MYXO-CTERM domain-containing protein